MKKTLFALAPAALLLLTVGSAQAASSAILTVSGSVAADSCNLNLDRPNIPLGQTAPDGFTPNQIRTVSLQPVMLTITDCTAAPEDGKTATLQVSGSTLDSNSSIFNNSSSSNVGVMVMNGDNAVANGDIITVATGDSIIGATQRLNVGFASTASMAEVSLVNASIMFNLLVS